MARKTVTMIDVTEILEHWYAGAAEGRGGAQPGGGCQNRPPVRGPGGGGRGAGPGGPPVTPEQWRALARQWFPQVAGAGVRQVSWREIAVHHDRIAALVGMVPVSVIHQRLADEAGLEASVASVRRYVRAHFPAGARAGEVQDGPPARPAGCRSPGGTGYLGLWPDPATSRRRIWAFSMVLPYSRHLFVRPGVSMTQRAWTEAHVAALEFLGGAPRRLVPDNLKAGVCKTDL